MIRKYRLELKNALIWLGLSLFTIFLAIFPNFPTYFASLIGIETPVNALFMLFIVFNLAIMFSLTVAISNSSNKIKDLVQEIGILKKEIESLKK